MLLLKIDVSLAGVFRDDKSSVLLLEISKLDMVLGAGHNFPQPKTISSLTKHNPQAQKKRPITQYPYPHNPNFKQLSKNDIVWTFLSSLTHNNHPTKEHITLVGARPYQHNMEGLSVTDANLVIYLHPSQLKNASHAILRQLSSLLFKYIFFYLFFNIVILPLTELL